LDISNRSNSDIFDKISQRIIEAILAGKASFGPTWIAADRIGAKAVSVSAHACHAFLMQKNYWQHTESLPQHLLRKLIYARCMIDKEWRSIIDNPPEFPHTSLCTVTSSTQKCRQNWVTFWQGAPPPKLPVDDIGCTNVLERATSIVETRRNGF